MEDLHIPPWDVTSSSFQEYPNAVAFTKTQSAGKPAKLEKALIREQEKLQTMINGIVRLSAISSSTAGGSAPETANSARRKRKKEKRRPQGEPDKGHGLTQNIQLQNSQQAATNKSKDETICPAGAKKQPKLCKRKAVDLSSPLPGLKAQPLPASTASQQEGTQKRSKRQVPNGQESVHRSLDATQDGASAPSEAAASNLAPAAQEHREQAGMGVHNQPGPQQHLQSNLGQDPAPSSRAAEAIRKKRSRNKFTGGDASGQPGLPKSIGTTAETQAPDVVRTKRSRNKFKQVDAAGQQALPKSLVPEAPAAPQSSQTSAAAGLGNAKQRDTPAQHHRPQPAPSAVQHTKHSGKGTEKEMKGPDTGQRSRVTGLALKPLQNAGKSTKGEATPSSQVAAAGAGASRQKEDGLLGRMRAKLAGSQFRWLNEQLYTCPGSQAFELMQEQPQLFTQYHEGFKQQTAKWPLQPIQAAAAYLAKQSRKIVVADFGCGDAELARMAPQETVHSLDLVSSAPGVIACNMAETPLDTASVDVAVFCLALMGTDYPSFLQEAARVLKAHGNIWIAEVRSRFVPEDGVQEDYRPFLQAMEGLGFAKRSVDCSNSHFVTFELQRQKPLADREKLQWPQLRACTYKKR